jgi:hypothetical protein
MNRADGATSGWVGGAGAERLFTRVQGACPDGADFPARLEAGLRVTLDLLSEDPDLAHLLTVEPILDAGEEERAALRGWVERFGVLLRDAAAADPRSSTVEPPFLAPFLIGGIRFQIARLVLAGEATDLPRLLPTMLPALLA